MYVFKRNAPTIVLHCSNKTFFEEEILQFINF